MWRVAPSSPSPPAARELAVAWPSARLADSQTAARGRTDALFPSRLGHSATACVWRHVWPCGWGRGGQPSWQGSPQTRRLSKAMDQDIEGFLRDRVPRRASRCGGHISSWARRLPQRCGPWPHSEKAHPLRPTADSREFALKEVNLADANKADREMAIDEVKSHFLTAAPPCASDERLTIEYRPHRPEFSPRSTAAGARSTTTASWVRF